MTGSHNHPHKLKVGSVNQHSEDPFFTLTSRGMRRCYSYSNCTQLSIGYIFIEDISPNINQTLTKQTKSNLLYSLRRAGENPTIRILKTTNLSEQQKLLTILRYIQSNARSLPRILLFSTSLNVLLLSSPKSLEEKFHTFHKRLLLSNDNPCGLGIGHKKEIVKFFFPVAHDNRLGLARIVNDYQLKKMTELHYLNEYSKGHVLLDQDFVILTSQSQSVDSISRSGSALIQFPHPLTLPGSSSGYNLYLQSSSMLTLDEAPYHHHSYDHFLSFRSQYRVIMSLTTLPHRLPHLTPVLRSLLDQHVKPDQVYLNIPSSYRRFQLNDSVALQIPDEIKQLALNDVLKIQLIPFDYGPASKLIPTLQVEQNPSTIIITVDDDMIYKPTQVQILLKAYFQYPFAAYGHAGQLIDLDHPRGLRGENSGRRRVAVRTAWQWKDSHYAVDILEAFRCALYRRDYFQDLSELTSIPDSCVFTDDIWISAYLSRRGIPRIKLAQGWGDVAEFSPNDNITPLRDQNLNGTKRNDICAELLLQDFIPGWITPEGMEERGEMMEDCQYQYHSLPNQQ